MRAPSKPSESPLQDLAEKVESALQGRIESAELVSGGYTAQRVLRLRMAGGESYVMKAAPPRGVDARLDWPAELEREIELYGTHPELDPWRPRALGEFRAGGWLALLMEDLGDSLLGSEWTESRLATVAAGLAAMHRASAAGSLGVVHGDVRSDNLFATEGGALLLVDWADWDTGSGVEDAVYWAIGVELEGGACAADALARYEAVAGRLPASEVDYAVASLRRSNRRRLRDPLLPEAVRRLRLRELTVLDRWPGG